MITVKLPLNRTPEGSIEFHEYLQEWVAGKPLSHYISEDLLGVELNRVILSGRSMPEHPHRDLSNCDKETIDTILNETIPVDGDEIILIPALSFEAITIFGASLGVGFGTTTLGIIANTIVSVALSLAVSMAISTLLSYLTAPAKSKGDAMGGSATSFGWNGIQNTFGPGGPIPVIFGEHRVPIHVIHYSIEEEAGTTLGQVIDLSKTQSYVKILGVVGHGEGEFSDIQINDNPIANFGPAVQYYTRPGTLDQLPIPGFDEVKTTFELGIEVTDTPYTYTTTAGIAITGYQLHFEAPYGFYIAQGGDYAPNSVKFKVEHRIWTEGGTNPWTTVQEFRMQTFKMSTVRWSKTIRDLSPDRYDVRVTRTGVWVAIDGVSGYRFWLKKVTEAIEDNPRSFPGYALIAVRGLATEHLSDNPPTITAIFKAKHPVWNGSAWVDALTSNPGYLGRSAMLNQKWGFGNWVPSTHVNDAAFIAFANYCDECNLIKYSEEFDRTDWVKNGITVTPNTVLRPYGFDVSKHQVADTLTATTVNATITQSITGISRARTGSIYLKRKTGTGSIHISVDGANWTDVILSNTEWLRVSDSRTSENPSFTIKIDTSGDEIYAWGAMINIGTSALSYLYTGAIAELPRHTCNFVWNQRRKFFPLMMDIFGPCRGMFFRAGGKWTAVADRPRTPTQLFTMGNIVRGSFKPEWVDETLNYNALDVSYLAKNQNYKPFSFRADLGDSVIKPKNSSVFGIVEGNEVIRSSLWQLNCIKNLHALCTFQAGIDAVLCLPGDLLMFSHEYIRYGLGPARAAADSTELNEITLDEPITLVEGKTYQVLVRFSGGANPDLIETRTIANTPGTYTVLTVTADFTQLVKLHDLITVGEVDHLYKIYNLMAIERKSNHVCELRAVEYSEACYFDHGIIDDTSVLFIPNPIDLPPPKIVSANVVEEVRLQDNNIPVSNLSLHWPVPEDAPNLGKYLGANVYNCNSSITRILGDFEEAEGWVGGEINLNYGEYRKNMSQKVVPSSGNWEATERTISVDLSGIDDYNYGVWFYVKDRTKLYDGQCIRIRFYTGADSYFEYGRERTDISDGWNCILEPRENFATVGTPSWDNITKYHLAARGTVATAAEVSFCCFDTFPTFAWDLKASVEGSICTWENVKRDSVMVFKLHPFADSSKRPASPYATYAFIEVTGLDLYPPDLSDVILTAKSEGYIILLEWTKEYRESDLVEWQIYRSITNNPSQAPCIAQKGGNENSFRDTTASVNWTYYYWLTAKDYQGNISGFSEAVSITHKYQSPPITLNPVPAGDLPTEDGTLGYTANSILLHNCDDVSSWIHGATIANSIILSQENVDIAEGSGSLKVKLFRYAKQRYYENGTSVQRCGWWNNRYLIQGVKPEANFTMKAVGLKLTKTFSPANILVKIYTDNAGLPGNLLGTATLLASAVSTSLAPEPDDYKYAIFSSTIELTADVLYWIVLDAQQWSPLSFYNIYGYYGDTNQFGDADEVLKIGANITAPTSHPTWDINFRLCAEGDALNKYFYLDLGAGATKDISTKTYFKNYIKSTRAGGILSQSFGEAAIGEQDLALSVGVAGVWELKQSNISGIGGGSRDAVRYIGFKITNMDADAVILIDQIFANIGEPFPYIMRGTVAEKILTEIPFNQALMRGVGVPHSLNGAALIYTERATVGTTILTVPAGKVWYLVHCKALGGYGGIYINDDLWWASCDDFLPANFYNQDIILDDDDHIDLTTTGTYLIAAWVLEVDEDPQILVLYQSVSNVSTYTVPAGCTLVMRRIKAFSAGTKLIADNIDFVDLSATTEILNSVSIFDEGTVLKADAASVKFFGYLIPKSV